MRRIEKIGLDAWKKEVDYGKRWRVEIFFSALKRTVGEVIMAKKLMYQIQESGDEDTRIFPAQEEHCGELNGCHLQLVNTLNRNDKFK